MRPRRHWLPGPLSLKSRFLLVIGLLIVLTATVLTLAAVLIAQRGIEDVIREREAALISQVTRDLDQKLLIRQNALVRLAADIGTARVTDLQQRLEQHHSLDGFFSNLSVLDARGEHVANMNQPLKRGKTNFASRSYFSETMRSGAPVISRPLRSELSGRPMVVMTAPIRGPEGGVRNVLVGIIDLGRDSFITERALGRSGKNGYFYIVTRDGVLVSHPDESRILSRVGSEVPSLIQALDGFEGTINARTQNGEPALLSYQQLPSTGWIVAAVYPTREAFAFASAVRINAAIIAALLLLLLAPVGWLVIDRQLRPLSQLGKRMAEHRAAPRLAPVPHKDDEIGDLWRAFDALMEERDRAELAMADSERHLRLVADNVPALVSYVDCNERFVFGNSRYQTLFGYSPSQMTGKTILEVIGKDVYAQSKQYIDAALRGESVCFERPVIRNGALQWDRAAYKPDIGPDGKVNGYFVLVDDITELKQTQAVLALNEKRIRTITDNLPALISYVDTEQRYQFCNSAYERIVGIAPDQIIGKTVREVFGPQTYAAVAAHIASALCGKHVSFERFATEHNANKYLQFEYIPDIGADGQVAGFYSMVMDITERKAAELALASQQRLLRTVTDNLPALVNFIDRDGRFQFINRHHEGWFQRPLGALQGGVVRELLDPAERAVHLRYFEQAMQGDIAKFDFARKLNGELRHYHATYIPQFEEGAVVGVTGLVNDVTDAKLVEQQLSALARFDGLTGLPNRTHLGERIARARVRSARSGLALAVMYLDLDKFKSINDSFGHSGGDAVLIEFGRRLSACVRESDTVGRLAGDEFVILLEGLHNDAECALVARKIIKVMEKPFDIEGVARIVTTSIGVASAIGGSASVDSLLKHADDALYRAKEKGRNRYAMTAVK